MREKQFAARDTQLGNFATLEEPWNFWDAYSIAGYEDVMEPVAVEMDLHPQQWECQ